MNVFFLDQVIMILLVKLFAHYMSWQKKQEGTLYSYIIDEHMRY